eukprot:Gb_32291 [translate_table: standard]
MNPLFLQLQFFACTKRFDIWSLVLRDAHAHTKVGHGFSTQTLQDIAGNAHGKPSSPGLPTILWKHFRLHYSQYRSCWSRLDESGSVQESAKKAYSIPTSLRFAKHKQDFGQPQNFKGFSVFAASAGMTCHAQAAWRRLSLICCYGGPTFPPISRIARAVSLACARSHLAPRVLAVIIGEASWAHKRCAEAEQSQTSGPLYIQALNRHAIFTSCIWSLLEGLILVIRALYLMALFTPAITMAPFADAFGGKYRKMWLQLVRQSLEKAGAAFIKWGQWAATRPDLFPRDLCNELAKMHSKAPAHKFSYTQRVIEKAFGRKLAEIFEDFEEEPVASGSIAQVHRAALRFRYPGQKVKPMMVAVKVRHPGVSEVIRRDFVIINWVAKVSSLLPALRWLRLDESVQQFAVFMLSQVDLAREAAHLSRFLYNFRRWKDVSFPKPLYPLVHPAVLVETYEQGESVARYVDQPDGNNRINKSLAHIGTHTLLKMLLVSEVDISDKYDCISRRSSNLCGATNSLRLNVPLGNPIVPILHICFNKESSYSCILVAEMGDMYMLGYLLKTIVELPNMWVDNFIHADMHPGNILVRVGEGKPSTKRLFRYRPHVVFLDVGMTAELSNNDRLNLIEFFKSVALRDGRTAAECTLKFSRHQSCPDPNAFIKAGIFSKTGKAGNITMTLGLGLHPRGFSEGVPSMLCWREVESSFKFWGSPEGDEVHPAECMQELLEKVRRHKVNIDGNVCTVMVTTLVLEGWQRKLDPDYNIMDTLQTLLFKADWAKSLSYTIEGLMAP